jgi:hypothetical protein
MFTSPYRLDRLWCPLSHLSSGHWGQSGRGIKLSSYLRVVPRSRKHGSIHPLPIRLHGVVVS